MQPLGTIYQGSERHRLLGAFMQLSALGRTATAATQPETVLRSTLAGDRFRLIAVVQRKKFDDGYVHHSGCSTQNKSNRRMMDAATAL